MIENSGERKSFFDGISFIPDSLLIEWTARLASGERGKQAEGWSRAIIRDFILRASLSKPQSQVTLDWLADALAKILNFEDARSVLALPTRPKSRPPGERFEYGLDAALWVKLAMDRNYSEPVAIRLAAKQFACDTKTIGRWRKASAAWVQAMNPATDWVAYFGWRGRPLPPPVSSEGQ